MLIVVQFPMADARGLSPDPAARVSRPDWGNIETFGNTSFVRRFGSVVDRKGSADPAWVDERYFCQAQRAIALTGLQKGRDLRCAFRRLFVADGRVVTRVEIGFVTVAPKGLTPEQLLATAQTVARLGSQVADGDDAGRPRPLIGQGRRLARLYARATTRTGADSEFGRLVEPGRPLMIVDLHPKEQFVPPPGARKVYRWDTGGSDLAFLRMRTDFGALPLWITHRRKDPARARSLRLCLLRVHAEQECLEGVMRLRERQTLGFAPETDSARALQAYLNAATKNLNKDSWGGISQSAVLDAINAADVVVPAAEREGVRQSLQGVQFQIAEKTEAFLREREAKRSMEVYHVEQGGKLVKDSITFDGSNNTFTNVSIVNARKMRDALVTLQQSPAADERKQAVEELVKVATQLVERLPDDKSKNDVTSRVELITSQAQQNDPIEEAVRGAGQVIVNIGQGVADLAAPIAKAVNTVLSVLKLAPIVL
jgi:hypothetical protein